MPRPVTLFTGQWADLPFEQGCALASEWSCLCVLNAIGYAGPLSVAWEGAGMDRLTGAPDALAFTRRLTAIAPPAAAFDAAFTTSHREVST